MRDGYGTLLLGNLRIALESSLHCLHCHKITSLLCSGGSPFEQASQANNRQGELLAIPTSALLGSGSMSDASLELTSHIVAGYKILLSLVSQGLMNHQ